LPSQNEGERPSMRYNRTLSSTSSLHDSIIGTNDFSMNSTATTDSLERLQRQLKRRDGEVYILQVVLI